VTTLFAVERLGMMMAPEATNPLEVEGVLNPAGVRGLDGHYYLSPRRVAAATTRRRSSWGSAPPPSSSPPCPTSSPRVVAAATAGDAALCGARRVGGSWYLV